MSGARDLVLRQRLRRARVNPFRRAEGFGPAASPLAGRDLTERERTPQHIVPTGVETDRATCPGLGANGVSLQKELRYGSAMEDEIEVRLKQLGDKIADLDPIAASEFSTHEMPPIGAGALKNRAGDFFIWTPIQKESWHQLSPLERGRIVADRTIAWVEMNANTLSPIDVSGALDPSVRQFIGIGKRLNVKMMVCAAYKSLHEHPTATGLVVAICEEYLFRHSGLPDLYFVPGVFHVVILLTGSVLCKDDTHSEPKE